MNKIKILGIVGSLRQDSYNAFALKAAQALVPNDVALELIDLHGIPLYSQDDEMSPPSAVQALKQRILDADAILFATPEYNYSLPGALRNAINWASRPYGETAWKGKPAAVMGASVGSLGTARAQSHLRKMLVALDMPVVKIGAELGYQLGKDETYKTDFQGIDPSANRLFGSAGIRFSF